MFKCDLLVESKLDVRNDAFREISKAYLFVAFLLVHSMQDL